MNGLRVLICGGRDMDRFDAENLIDLAMMVEIEEIMPCREVGLVIHGGARGADEGAARWAESEGVKSIAFPADWKKHGKAAGPIRNRRMLDEGKPDVVVALPGGRGTADMIRQAEEAGVPVVRLS